MNNSESSAKIGWLCGYTPIEILHAAGLQQERIFGHGAAINKADSYMHPNLCPYVRSVLDIALEGGYARLSGLLFVNSCDAMRRLRDVFLKYVPLDFNFIIDMPRGRTDADVTYLKKEYEKLVGAIEERFGAKITPDTLRQSIAVYHESRELYREICDARKEKPPRITGADVMRLGWLMYTSTPEAWNEKAREILALYHVGSSFYFAGGGAGSKNSSDSSDGKPRILLTGNLIHSPDVLDFIEDCGLDVVYDDTCTGGRFFEMRIGDTGDPLEDLARAYLLKPGCARMMVQEERIERIVAKTAEFGAAGVIHHTLKFCDSYQYDVPVLKNALSAEGIRTLFVEGDCTLGSFGQLKTRIEAFAEMLQS